ncbi:MAG: RagB/SusD family nutrient uptake outer membrane protein [Prevotella sp.]|nr:RagB/SusD family nutrient uptake outer membrane protein [Prevotella sp.]
MKKLCMALSFTTLSFSVALTSCSLDETNYSTLDQEIVYQSDAGFNGLVEACYENIYYLYGKMDGIDLMEMGTDLWMNGGRNGSHGELTNYNENLNTSTGVVRVVWNALYGIVSYCNTAIYYQNNSSVAGGSAADSTRKAKVAEAYFLRGFANWHIVENWGGVVLNNSSIAQSGAQERAERATEEQFYDQIISDLQFAAENLPETQGDRGRVTKWSALAMLAKAYLQRTRLYANGSAEKKHYAEMAYEAAQQVIAAKQLYQSDATQSGSTKYWLPENNKNNQENLFIEAVDHVGGFNPEWWNRGRTRQYYQMAIGSAAQNFGISSDGWRYGRANATVWRPTLYLLQECFEPSETTPDTRFSDSFYYKYYIGSKQHVISKSTWATYGKDVSLYNTRRASSYTITGNVASALDLRGTGFNFYADNGTATDAVFELENNDAAMGCFTPNWDLDSAWCAHQKFLAAGPNQYMDKVGDGPDKKVGGLAKNSYMRSLMPSLKKFSCVKYLHSNQECEQDIAIIRLTDIYLTAAEAAVISGEHLNEGLDCLNAVRRHAALSTNAAQMEVTMAEMNIDYILKERARELCGEQWRWYDLKRTGNLNLQYLSGTGRNPYITIFQQRHLVRPVPQEFLDQIANADEFGTNGY